MLHYLIDAYNLIYADAELKNILEYQSAEKAAEELFSLLSKFAYHNNKKKFTLIFDGSPYDIHSPFDNVYIEGSGKYKADDIIKQYVSSAVNAKNYIVVTSDREIISFGKQYFAEYYLSEQFILELRMFNKSTINEEELNIYKKNDKEEFRAKDLLLKYFNENPIDPDTLEEIEVPKKEKVSENKSKREVIQTYQEKELSNEELSKLLDHFS